MIFDSEKLSELKSIDLQLKELQNRRNEITNELLGAMIAFDETNVKQDGVQLICKQGGVRQTFDAKAFKEEYPELHYKFIKESEVKPSLTVKIYE